MTKAEMATGRPTTVAVDYRMIEGTHVFTSKDIYGLYVASSKLEVAFEAIAPSIEQLLKLNENVSCSVRPTVTLREFLNRVRGSDFETPHPAFLSSRQFVFDCH